MGFVVIQVRGEEHATSGQVNGVMGGYWCCGMCMENTCPRVCIKKHWEWEVVMYLTENTCYFTKNQKSLCIIMETIKYFKKN